MKQKTYIEQAIDLLKEFRRITHKDIIAKTNCNCPYGIPQAIETKLQCKLAEEQIRPGDTYVNLTGKKVIAKKPFKVFYLPDGVECH